MASRFRWLSFLSSVSKAYLTRIIEKDFKLYQLTELKGLNDLEFLLKQDVEG